MKQQIKDIIEFHTAFGCGVKTEPGFPDIDTIALRHKLLTEEVYELAAAAVEKDSVEALDAIIDCMYILYGTAAEFGLLDKLEDAWNLVAANNMSKLGPDGKPIRREDGKIIKPEGYKPVDLSILF